MNNHNINPNKVGLAFAVFLGCFHAVWAALVALGWAQALLNFIFWLHFITPVYLIEGFVLSRALGLVLVTASIGYVFGYAFGSIWNIMHRD